MPEKSANISRVLCIPVFCYHCPKGNSESFAILLCRQPTAIPIAHSTMELHVWRAAVVIATCICPTCPPYHYIHLGQLRMSRQCWRSRHVTTKSNLCLTDRKQKVIIISTCSGVITSCIGWSPGYEGYFKLCYFLLIRVACTKNMFSTVDLYSAVGIKVLEIAVVPARFHTACNDLVG